MKSEEYWQEISLRYIQDLDGDYHRHRMAVIDALLPSDLLRDGSRVFDFGCGNGAHLVALGRAGVHVRGCDPAEEMIAQAGKLLKAEGLPSDRAVLGGLNVFRELPDASLDGVLCLNVLAYLSNDEEEEFYRTLTKVLKPGGYFLVTHSNRLFDFFSLNGLTTDLFVTDLVADPRLREKVSDLIVHGTERPEPSYNVRENPLSYRYKLHQYDLEEIRQEFINLHAAPPLLMEQPMLEKKQYPATLNTPPEERWKLLFTCSTFGSLSRKIDGGTPVA